MAAMPVFEVVAINPQGKRVKQKIEAADIREATRTLLRQGLTVIDIKEVKDKKEQASKGEKKKGGLGSIEIRLPIGGGVSAKDLSILSKQLGALIKAGIGIVDALELVAEAIDNKNLKKVLLEIAEELREGSSLSKALRKRKMFPDFFVSMVEVGEETGNLDTVLFNISDYYQRIAEIINKIKSVSFYPTFVILAAGGITFGIIYFLVPTFAQIYKSFGAELPAPTQMLIDASDWLKANIGQFLIGLAAFITLFILAYKRVYAFKKLIHALQLKIPMFAPLFQKGALAKIARTFATLFASGVSVERAIELSAEVAGNVLYEEALLKAKEDIMAGEPIWKALEKTKMFPRMFIAMVRIGEETGQLDNMLTSLADFYEDEVRTTIDGLISMIEPMLMVVIGGIVGGVLIALYLPIFKIGELIGK
jgi:type IV pilus assembly protein PilC